MPHAGQTARDSGKGSGIVKAEIVVAGVSGTVMSYEDIAAAQEHVAGNIGGFRRNAGGRQVPCGSSGLVGVQVPYPGSASEGVVGIVKAHIVVDGVGEAVMRSVEIAALKNNVSRRMDACQRTGYS